MVAELSALQQILHTLTDVKGLPVVIVECAVTTAYTCASSPPVQQNINLTSYIALGGFRISFITDNFQGAMVLGLIVLCVITVGVETDIDRSLVNSSGLLNASLLGW